MTGHAHHFLSRLDRTSAAETELALSLYRDPALLRSIIELVRPDRASPWRMRRWFDRSDF